MSAKDIQKTVETPIKKCEWCGEPLKTNDKRVKYHIINSKGIHCKKEAQREKTRIRTRKYDKKKSKKDNIEKLGTPDTYDLPKFSLKNHITYLGKPIPYTEFCKEYQEIHKLVEKLSVRPINKGKKHQQNTQQHKGVSPFDYDQFNISFLLENPGPCPICGEKLQEKDITRCELICRNPDCPDGEGGLVLRGTDYKTDYPESPGNRMAFTSQDVADSESLKRYDRYVSVQDIAWSNFWKD